MDPSKIIIALHSLVSHGHGPVPVYGQDGRPVAHARFDETTRTHVARIPYERWKSGVGAAIIRFGTAPGTQWLPLVEFVEDNATADDTEGSDANPPPGKHPVDGTSTLGADIPSKLPGERVAGAGLEGGDLPSEGPIPETLNKSHLVQEPNTPDEQRTAVDDHRVQLVQTVIPAVDEGKPQSDAPVIPDANKQLNPVEQINSKDDARVQATETVIEPAPENAAVAQGDAGSAPGVDSSKLAEQQESAAVPTPDQTEAAQKDIGSIQDFRVLRAVAKEEGVPDVESHTTPEDMRAAIVLHREAKAEASPGARAEADADK